MVRFILVLPAGGRGSLEVLYGGLFASQMIGSPHPDSGETSNGQEVLPSVQPLPPLLSLKLIHDDRSVDEEHAVLRL